MSSGFSEPAEQLKGNPPKLQKEVDRARERTVWNLRRWLRAGDNVYCVKRYRSWAGRFSVFALIIPDGLRRVRPISEEIAAALGLVYDRQHRGVVVRDWTGKRHSELTPIESLVEVELDQALFADQPPHNPPTAVEL